MIHTLEVSCRSPTYPELYRDTAFTFIVHPEMYRDTIFTIEIYPDMYHDTVSLAMSSRFSCVLYFCGCTRASFVLFGHSNTRVSPDVSFQGSLSKVSNVEVSQLEGIPCHEWYSVLLGRTQFYLLVQVGNLEFSCCVPGSLSWYEGE